MRRTTPLPNRRPFRFETLEARRVMAAYINEIHFAPLFGDNTQDQYVELRGQPNSQLANGTYLVAVTSSDGVRELGDVHTIFDLSNQSFGANGMLVLMQSAGGYSIDSQARVLRGTDGFLGMAGGIFQADSASKSIQTGSATYLLIQSSVAPQLTNDIDGNDDGVPDGAYLNWTIIDSVAVFPWGESVWPQRSYAQITFRERNVGLVMPGTTSVATDQLAYVARINRSTGYAAEDWVAGNTVEKDSGGGPVTWQFQLQHGVFGTPRPFAYGGRVLDHVGSENWVGGVAGSVFQDTNSDGIQQTGEEGIAGVKVYATIDGDTTPGYDVDRIIPNNFLLNSDVSNASPYVTIVSAGSDNVPQGFKIRVVQRAFQPTGEYIFSHEGVGFFNEDRRMRMDFYAPAHAVSITFIGNSNTQPTYGRLEIFNKANESLGWLRTVPLGSGQSQRLALNSVNDDIAWALAYPENSYLDSSPFGMLDDLEVIVPEKFAVTDGNGRYVLPAIPRDEYQVLVKVPPTYDQVYPLVGHTVTINGNEQIGNINFGLIGNLPPQLSDHFFSARELSAAGSQLGTLSTVLGYPSQQLRYTITDGDPGGLFEIDAAGRLRLLRSELDFETRPSLQLSVLAEDIANNQLRDTALIQLAIEDDNEPPVITGQSVSLPENSLNGTLVTTMSAVDPDAGQAGQFTWSIISGNTGNAFAIDSSSGAVTVNSSTVLNFEQVQQFQLVLRATDKGTPPQLSQTTLTIALTDINEAPVILGQALALRENSPTNSSAGKIVASDPDQGQTLTWTVTGGSGQDVFEVNANTGEVFARASLNHEAVNEYTLEVTVTDSGPAPLSSSNTITIVITDENDAPRVEAAEFTVAENSVSGTTVGSVIADDEDLGQTLIYSISGNDAANFTIDASTGQLHVAAGATLDFESRASLQLTVTVTDDGQPTKSAQADITITLTDVNEAPQISNGPLSVAENSAGGTLAGQLQAVDADQGDELTWSLESQVHDWFELDAETGELKVKSGAAIDFESTPTNQIVVQVADRSGLTDAATMTVQVLDRNDPPRATQTLPEVKVNADQPLTYTLPENLFVDPDVGDRLSLFVTQRSGFPLPSWLSYSASTRTFSGTPTADNGGTLEILITALDTSSASASVDLSIVVDANRFPWHNAQMPLDVTGDARVTARDALLIINHLNTKGSTPVLPGSLPTDGYLDTSGDNVVSARDVLLVINQLNIQAASEGEGDEEVASGQAGAATSPSTRQLAIDYDAAILSWMSELKKRR